MALQISILLLTKTDTATTSGLQTFFQSSFFGIDSYVVLREAYKFSMWYLNMDVKGAFIEFL